MMHRLTSLDKIKSLTPQFLLTSQEHSAMVKLGASVDHLFTEERFKLLGEMQGYELAFHIKIINHETELAKSLGYLGIYGTSAIQKAPETP